MGIQSEKANQNNGWIKRLAFVAGVGLIIFWFAGVRAVTPDPNAIKVQGADTLGNVIQVQAVPPGASGTTQTFVTTQANGANTATSVALAATPGVTNYITGFEVTGSGATAASVINVTLTGVSGAGGQWEIVVPAGVTTSITPLIIQFNPAIPASAVNTAITVAVPAFGAGNTNAATTIHGFRQ